MEFRATPVVHERVPPLLEEGSEEVLEGMLGLGKEECAKLLTVGVIGAADRLAKRQALSLCIQNRTRSFPKDTP